MLGDWCGRESGKSLGRSEKCSSLPFASGGLGNAGLMVGFDHLRGPFQPKQVYDLWQVCSMPKTQTFAGAWWPYAELVMGECYLAMCPVLTNTALMQAKSSLGHDVVPVLGCSMCLCLRNHWCGFKCIHKWRNGSSESWGSIALLSQLV